MRRVSDGGAALFSRMELNHVPDARSRGPWEPVPAVRSRRRLIRPMAASPTRPTSRFKTGVSWIAGRGRAGDGLAGPGDRLECRARLGRRAFDGLCAPFRAGLSGGVLSPGSSATSSASTGSIARSWSSAASGSPAAGVVFALFAGLGALQFLAIAVIDRHLDRAFDALALRSATAVVLAELLMPRLFPWHFGHTQIAFTPFVQVAGIGGAMAVSFLMFWLAEVAVRVVAFRERRRAFLRPGGRVRALDRVWPGDDGAVRLAAGRTAGGRHRPGPCRAAPSSATSRWPGGISPGSSS